MSEDCVFCRIAAGEIPAEVVARTESSVAFFDLAPQAPLHLLVVPRRHVEHAGALTDTDGALLLDLFLTARHAAESLGVGESGYRLVLNVGEDAQNSVPHLHLHVLGGRRFGWPPG